MKSNFDINEEQKIIFKKLDNNEKVTYLEFQKMLNYGLEFIFVYNKNEYEITYYGNEMIVLSNNINEEKIFNNKKTFFLEARIEGKTLEEIWSEVTIV